LLIFARLKFFSFFWWGDIRRISPQCARASRLLVASSCAAVRRYSLNFAPGVVQNLFQVGRNSSVAHQLSKTPPTYFWTSDAISTHQEQFADRRALQAEREGASVKNRKPHGRRIANNWQLIIKERARRIGACGD
jgi:hypothetical protein